MITWGLMQPVAGTIADRCGTRPVILSGVLVMALGFGIMGLASDLWLIAIGFGLLVGISTSASGFIIFSLLISKWFARARRASGVGLVQAAIPAGPIVIAPAMYLAITTYGWRFAAFGLGLLLLLVALPLAYIGVRDPVTPVGEKPSSGPQANWRESLAMLRVPALRNVFISRLACGLSTLMVAHLAASALDYGLTAREGAIAVSVYGGSAAVASFAGGLAADRWGRMPALVATFLLRGAGTLAMAIFPLDSTSFYILVAITTGPIFATVGINNVQVFEIVGARRAGFLLGMSLILHQLSAAIGPLFSGMIFDWTGTYRVSFFVLAVLLLLATIPSAGTKHVGPPVEIDPTPQPAKAI